MRRGDRPAVEHQKPSAGAAERESVAEGADEFGPLLAGEVARPGEPKFHAARRPGELQPHAPELGKVDLEPATALLGRGGRAAPALVPERPGGEAEKAREPERRDRDGLGWRRR